MKKFKLIIMCYYVIVVLLLILSIAATTSALAEAITECSILDHDNGKIIIPCEPAKFGAFMPLSVSENKENTNNNNNNSVRIKYVSYSCSDNNFDNSSSNFYEESSLLADRGECSFYQKAFKASLKIKEEERFLLISNSDNDIFPPSITEYDNFDFRVLMISNDGGKIIKNALKNSQNVIFNVQSSVSPLQQCISRIENFLKTDLIEFAFSTYSTKCISLINKEEESLNNSETIEKIISILLRMNAYNELFFFLESVPHKQILKSFKIGNTLGEILIKHGNFQEALSLYYEFFRSNKEVKAIPYIATLQFAMGDFSQSLKFLDEQKYKMKNADGDLWLCQNELKAFQNANIQWNEIDYTCSTKKSKKFCCEGSSRRPKFPDLYDVHSMMGIFLDEIGAFSESLVHLSKAASLCPSERLQDRIILATPIVYSSKDNMIADRINLFERMEKNIADIGNSITAFVDSPLAHYSITPPSMFIGYQDLDDSLALKKVYNFFNQKYPLLKKASSSSSSSLLLPSSGNNNSGNNDDNDDNNIINVGFVSSYFFEHSVGRLISGIINDLDEKRFKVHIFFATHFFGPPQRESGSIAERLIQKSNLWKALPSDLDKASSIISSNKLDILVYPELGMDTWMLFLAQRRLADKQVVFWGHPVSQGLPSIDYFISSDLYEYNVDRLVDTRYSEQVILMDSLTIKFTKPSSKEKKNEKQKMDFGLHTDSHIYFIPQTLMKFHVAFDNIIYSILKADELGYIFITYNENHIIWKSKLEQRFRTVMGDDIARRIRLIPTMDKADFYSFLSFSDVVLDPFPFGGGVTSLETFAAGSILITLPSKQSVVQLASGMYRKMDVLDFIVHNETHYIDTAIKVANDREFRIRKENEIKEKHFILYENKESVQEWERLFVNLKKSSSR